MEILLIAIALAMDSFALSIASGAILKDIKFREALSIAFVFALFQGFMPLFGFILALQIDTFVLSFHKILVCLILVFVGIKFVLDSKKAHKSIKLSLNALLVGGFLTSIDAFMVGITFAFKHISIQNASLQIACICFIFCMFGVYLGKTIGRFFESKALIFGGIMLIIIGIKSLF